MKLSMKKTLIVSMVTLVGYFLVLGLSLLSYGVYKWKSAPRRIDDKMRLHEFVKQSVDGAIMRVREYDTVLYLCANGLIVNSRNPRVGYEFGQEATEDAKQYRNNVFVVVDRYCPWLCLVSQLDWVDSMCTKQGCKMFIVGQLGKNRNQRVCEIWAGDWDRLTWCGVELDWSTVGSWSFLDSQSWHCLFDNFGEWIWGDSDPTETFVIRHYIDRPLQ